jgi:hypothetical protein
MIFIIRMDTTNSAPLDYYLIPPSKLPQKKLWLRRTNAGAVDVYRSGSFEPVFEYARQHPATRAQIPERAP